MFSGKTEKSAVSVPLRPRAGLWRTEGRRQEL